MAEKDVSEKVLEDYNDVFADIYNTLVFKEGYIQEEGLAGGPTTSIYKTESGDSAEQFRDVLKTYGAANLSLMSLGIENQSEVDEVMPIRIMGYDYGTYRGMVKNKIPIVPVATIVLNFGERPWNKAKSLHEMMQLPEKLKSYVEDYKIKVYDIAFLSDNVIEKFTSDFKFVARFFKDRRLKKNTLRKDEMAKIRHVGAVLELFSVFTKDDRYRMIYTEEVREKEKKGEEIDMFWMLQEIIDEGLEKGRKEGLEKGMEKGMEKGLARGLAAMVEALKDAYSSFEKVYQAVISTEAYAHVTEDQVREYYDR